MNVQQEDKEIKGMNLARWKGKEK